jgi:hypothetical protein
MKKTVISDDWIRSLILASNRLKKEQRRRKLSNDKENSQENSFLI